MRTRQRLVAWRPSARAFNVTPLVATGLVLCAVDLITALLATRLFDRAAALNPGSRGLPVDASQTLLLVMAAALVLLPMLHLVTKLLVFAVPGPSRWRAWLRAATATLCVPASLCPVVTLLLTTGH